MSGWLWFWVAAWGVQLLLSTILWFVLRRCFVLLDDQNMLILAYRRALHYLQRERQGVVASGDYEDEN